MAARCNARVSLGFDCRRRAPVRRCTRADRARQLAGSGSRPSLEPAARRRLRARRGAAGRGGAVAPGAASWAGGAGVRAWRAGRAGAPSTIVVVARGGRWRGGVGDGAGADGVTARSTVKRGRARRPRRAGHPERLLAGRAPREPHVCVRARRRAGVSSEPPACGRRAALPRTGWRRRLPLVRRRRAAVGGSVDRAAHPRGQPRRVAADVRHGGRARTRGRRSRARARGPRRARLGWRVSGCAGAARADEGLKPCSSRRRRRLPCGACAGRRRSSRCRGGRGTPRPPWRGRTSRTAG